MLSRSDENELARFKEFMQRPPAPDNDSGRGKESCLPDELQGLNWGALLLNIVWGAAMRVPWTWLLLVPVIGWIMPMVMWVKGNEWAWQYRHWESIEQFNEVQGKWAFWGFVFAMITVVLVIGLLLWMQRLMSQLFI